MSLSVQVSPVEPANTRVDAGVQRSAGPGLSPQGP